MDVPPLPVTLPSGFDCLDGDELPLDGIWDFRPLPADGAEMGLGRLRVPGSWHTLPGWPPCPLEGPSRRGAGWDDLDLASVDRAVYAREIRLPAEWRDRRIVFEADRVSTDALVKVDGRAAGRVRWPEGWVDVTRFCAPGGTHRLEIEVSARPGRQFNAVIWDAGVFTPVRRPIRSRGLIGLLRLRAMPRGPRIDGVFLEADFALRRWFVTVDLGGRWPVGPLRVRAAARRWPDGAVVREFPAVALRRSGARAGRAAWSWPEVEPWEPDLPRLYTMEIVVSSPRGAAEASIRQRWGFREFRIRGRDFLLNGRVQRLRPGLAPVDATGGNPDAVRAWLRELRRHGHNLLELWPDNDGLRGSPEFRRPWSQLADEEGVLLLHPLPSAASTLAPALFLGRALRRAGWRAWLQGVERAWRRLRNHPSIVIWSEMANAFAHFDDQNPRRIGQRANLAAPAGYARSRKIRLGRRLIAAIRRLDRSRPVCSHHAGAVGDVHTMNHYLCLLPLQEREEWLSQWSARGDLPYLAVEFGVPFALTYNRGRMAYPRARCTEPLLTEHAATYLGPEAYRLESHDYRRLIRSLHRGGQDYENTDEPAIHLEPAFQQLSALFIRQTWRSWRTWGVSGGMLPWSAGYAWDTRSIPAEPASRQTPPDGAGSFYSGQLSWLDARGWRGAGATLTTAGAALETVNGPLLAWIAGPADRFTAKDHHFHPGERVAKSLVLINDTARPQPFAVRWRAFCRSVALAGGGLRGVVGPGEIRFERLEFTTPCGTEGKGRLVAAGRFGDGRVRDTLTFSVKAPGVVRAIGPAFQVWDPEGTTTAVLREAGMRVQLLDSPSGANPGSVLVVGRRALERTEAGALDWCGWIAAGGRVCFAAQAPAWLARSGLRVSRHVSRRCWPVAGSAWHPAVAGLESGDLCDWRGAGSLVPAVAVPRLRDNPPFYPPYGWHWGNRGSVASAAIEKPHHSGWTPLLEAEFDLAWSPLLELRHGRGVALLCQLDLEARGDAGPLPALLAGRLGAALADARTEAPLTGEVAVLGPEATVAWVRSLGAEARAVSSLPASGVVVVAGQATPGERDLRRFAAAGGRLLLLPRAEDRLPFGFRTRVAETAGAVPPPRRRCWRGVSVSDLHVRVPVPWRAVVGGPPGASIAGEGVAGQANVGRGVVVALQLAPFDLPADERTYLRYTRWRLTRLAAQLLANLGVAFASDEAWLRRLSNPRVAAPRYYHPDYRSDHALGDDPFRYYRW